MGVGVGNGEGEGNHGHDNARAVIPRQGGWKRFVCKKTEALLVMGGM